MTSSSFKVRNANWADDKPKLEAIRRTVFIEEQKVTEREEWDGEDEYSQHVLAETDSGNTIGTGRLMPNGQIGRVAVLPDWRGKQVGTALMQQLINTARKQALDSCFLHAQLSALDFYARLGFTVYGEEFMDANILHKAMRLRFS